MNSKTIASVALSSRDFPSFAARLEEAAFWTESAAHSGADLVVLPEALNLYRGDGETGEKALTFAEAALDDWRKDCAILVDLAARKKVAICIPVVTREGKNLTNSFFLVDRDGSVRGRYQKMRPTVGELQQGVQPGKMSLIEWEGLKIGGAICFDIYFPWVIEQQVQAGANLILFPGLTPGGMCLNYYAMHHSVPIVQSYPAWSRIVDLDGRDLAQGGYRGETLRYGFGTPVVLATLNFNREAFYADINQQRMNDVQKAYGRKVRITFDQPNMLFVVESLDPALSIREIIREFGLVSRRDYFRDPEASFQTAEHWEASAKARAARPAS
jgi:predicted amidohydrolase